MGAPKGNKNAAYSPAEQEALKADYISHLQNGKNLVDFIPCDYRTVEKLFVLQSEKDLLESAKRENRAWWYDLAQRAAQGIVQNANATLIVFGLKNKCGWRDKIDQDITSGGEKLSSVLQVELVRPEDAAANT
jgi:hypothetical protein